MTKKRQPQFKPRNEFRYNFSKRHKHFVFGESPSKYYSLGITHEEYTFGKKNLALSTNPQHGKKEKSFIRNGVIADKKQSYGRPLKGYKFNDNDYKNVKSKIRNFKKNKNGK